MTNIAKIEKITKSVRHHHIGKAEEETELKKAREEFFAEATKILKEQPRATKVVLWDGTDDVEEYVEKYYPGYDIVSVEVTERDVPNRVIVQEDPEYMKYSYISKDGRTIFQRGITQESESLDDKALKADDPELWIRITTSREEEFLLELLYEEPNFTPEVTEFMVERRDEFIRVLRPFDTLSSEDFAAVQKYIVPGKLKPTLLAPRKPKPEELE